MVSTWFGTAGVDDAESLAAALRVLDVAYTCGPAVAADRTERARDHLAQRLHLPARVVVAAVAALQRLDSMGTQWQQAHARAGRVASAPTARPARRLRGSAASAFALLVVSMRQTGQLAVAMDARGFEDAARRTWAAEAPCAGRDRLLVSGPLRRLAFLPWLWR